ESVKGLFYNVDLTASCTLITLKNRLFAGDAVLSLADTACKNLILFGSCGGVTMEPGEIVLASGALNMESFTELLRASSPTGFREFKPEKKLTDKLIKYLPKDIRKVTLATVSSLVLEETRTGLIKAAGADCVDMESSKVFSAAKNAGIKAAGLFYVTDTVGKIVFYDRYPKETAAKIKGARKSLANKLISFIKDEL
ncbi:MAG: hypothetical protein U9R36_03775, partial [Elusimicrobiota bacterium]|nr:hypothetical protein [Elusimicrobiota bacterium]